MEPEPHYWIKGTQQYAQAGQHRPQGDGRKGRRAGGWDIIPPNLPTLDTEKAACHGIGDDLLSYWGAKRNAHLCRSCPIQSDCHETGRQLWAAGKLAVGLWGGTYYRLDQQPPEDWR